MVRTPADLMYTNEFDDWRKANIDVQVTVDRGRLQAGPDAWAWLRCGSRIPIHSRKTAVLTCRPEITIHFVIYEALARRIPLESIFVSMERT